MTNRPHMRRRRRKLRQVLHELREVLVPTDMYIPEVVEIPKPDFGTETPPPEVYLTELEVIDVIGELAREYVNPKHVVIEKEPEPEKEVSFKRRSW